MNDDGSRRIRPTYHRGLPRSALPSIGAHARLNELRKRPLGSSWTGSLGSLRDCRRPAKSHRRQDEGIEIRRLQRAEISP